MKTPEEWTSNVALHALIAAIQSDARLSALEEAAKVCEKEAKAFGRYQFVPAAIMFCAQSIRSLASPAKKDTP